MNQECELTVDAPAFRRQHKIKPGDGQTADSSYLTVGQGTQAVTSSSDPVYSEMNLELFVIQTQGTIG